MDSKKIDRCLLIIAYIAIGISAIVSLYLGIYMVGIKYMLGFLGTHIGVVEILKIIAMMYLGIVVFAIMFSFLFCVIAIMRRITIYYLNESSKKKCKCKIINIEEYLKPNEQ